MAVLLRAAVSPSFSKWPSLTRAYQASWFFSAYQHQPFTTTPSTSTTKLIAPCTQDLLTNVQQRCLSQNFIQRRNFYSYFWKKRSPEQVKAEDKVETHFNLVYNAVSTTYIQLGYGGVQSVAGVFCVGLAAALFNAPLTDFSVIQEQPIEIAVFLTVNMIICLGILRICYWYPLRIYYSEVEDQFVAVFVGHHPLAVRHVKIQPGEVKPLVPGRITGALFSWTHHLYSSPAQTIHLNAHHFVLPFYYNKLLGYMRES